MVVRGGRGSWGVKGRRGREVCGLWSVVSRPNSPACGWTQLRSQISLNASWVMSYAQWVMCLTPYARTHRGVLLHKVGRQHVRQHRRQPEPW